MRPLWLIVFVSLAIAGLMCGLPRPDARGGVLREGIDSGTYKLVKVGGDGTDPGEVPASQAVARPAPQPPTGTPDQNKAAIKALRTQVNSLAKLAQMVGDHQQLLKANSTALVGKHGDGGMQKTVNECQVHCSKQSPGGGDGDDGDGDT